MPPKYGAWLEVVFRLYLGYAYTAYCIDILNHLYEDNLKFANKIEYIKKCQNIPLIPTAIIFFVVQIKLLTYKFYNEGKFLTR